MTQAEILPEIFKLKPSEQLLIADAIHRKIHPESETEFKQELAGRYEDFLKNPHDEIAWEDLAGELEKA